MNKTFIFDYDDTLAWNQHDYSYAQLKFIEWIIQRIGPRAPDVRKIITLEEEIDEKAVKTMGFSMERFPSSFRETYRVICKHLGIDDKSGIEEAYKIGMLAFDEERWKKQGLVEGAEETLDYLLEREDELILLTKGDPRVQQRKIEATNCKKWFGEKIFIVPKKDSSIIETVVGDRDKIKVWHVGNSIRSDVNPAIKAGINMIYIPLETWVYEERENNTSDLSENQKLLIFQNIIEIKDKYNLLG